MSVEKLSEIRNHYRASEKKNTIRIVHLLRIARGALLLLRGHRWLYGRKPALVRSRTRPKKSCRSTTGKTTPRNPNKGEKKCSKHGKATLTERARDKINPR